MRYLLNFDRSRWLLLTMLTLLMGISPAWAQKALPYSYGFEESSCSTSGWTEKSCHSSSENYNVGASGVHEGTYVYRFYYNSNPPQYLISPELATSTYPLSVSFWYKANASYEESFKFGYSTTDTETSSFTWEDEVKTKSTTWTEYTTTCPAGTKYICIAYTANDKYYIYIDDLNIEEASPYTTPKAFASTGVTATTASFSWTNGNDETAWQIAYSTTEGFDAESATKVDVTTNPYTLEGLTAETTYYARIRANYGSGNYSSWSEEISFTPTNAITTTVNDGSATNTNIPFTGNYADTQGTMAQFIIPAATLTSLQGRMIKEMTFYTSTASKDFGNARFDVYMAETSATAFDAATFDWSDMEKVATSASVNIADGKMTITLDEGFNYSSDNLKIGFNLVTTGGYVNASWYGIATTNAAIKSYISYGSANASIESFLPKITFTSLPGVPVAVQKPKNLAASETAATTATLGWTDGEEGLSAWQIAYSTNADFNPESEGTTVDADANPYTLTELTASTTYYAYVRAKKGDDYSSWSNKVEFTTLAAGPVMELSTTSINFGMVSDADTQAQTFTVTNTGGADLTNLSITCDNAAFTITDGEGNALPQTIAVGQTLTIKVTMNTVGQQSGTITISGDGIEAQTTQVGGYLIDNTKIAETFTAAVPNHWTEYAYRSGYYSTYNWTYSADGAYNTNENSTLTTPKVTVSEGESLTIYGKLKSNTTSGYITVEGSEDNGETWTAYTKKLDYEAFSSTTGEFQLITLSDVPTTVNKLRFKCYYAYLNAVNGFTYAADPVLALYSNEECTSAIAAEVNKSFGFVTEDQSQTYYIKNNGTGQIDLTANTVEGFSVNIADAALTEGESTAVTITMPATEGQHNAAIIVTATNHDTDAVLGTFTVNANGAVAGSKNDVNFATLSELPAGWETTNWTVTANSYVGVGYTAGDLISQTLSVSEGETLLVEAKGSSSYYAPSLSYSYKVGDAEWTEATAISEVVYSDWKIFAISGIPAGEVKVKFNGQYTNIRRVYGFEAKIEPFMVFAQAGTTKNFGMINAAATSEAYTITNSGAGELSNLSVTCNNNNFSIAVANDATTIAANGGTATFTVTLNTTTAGMQTGTVTISGDGVESKTFNVSGYVCDSEQLFEDITEALPENWENTSWSISNGAAYASTSSSKLVSPKLTIAENQKLAISAKLAYNSNYYYVKVEGYDTANSDWTYSKTLTTDVLNNTDFTVVEISDIPTTVNRIRLVGNYAYVNGIAGFNYDANDPKFAVFSDADCTAAINATTAINAWGFVSEDKTATYYIKNTGTGTMTLAATDAPKGFTAELGATALAAGESTSLTIGMENDAKNNEGYHTGNVVLTATDSESNVLGTFTIASSGVVVGSKTDINFAELTAFPAGWEATNWTVTANEKATIGYNTGTITTGTYTVAEGESMIVEACRNTSSSWYTPNLNYSYSADGGNTWSQAKAITPASTSKELIAISDIPAGDVLIRFTGTYVDIFRIYGYTAVAKANMALDKTAIDFGMQTAVAEETITVTNNGTAALTNLQVATTTDNYTAAADKTTLAVGESATITVTQLFDAANGLATLSDVLTISADGLADKTVNLSGKTRDASKQYIDFADGTIPATFVETGSWSVYSQYQYAHTTSSTETSMVTMPLTVAAGEKISFDAKNPYSGSLKVRYSLNGGISWSEYVDYSSQMNSSSFTTLALDLGNETDVTAVVEFCGRYYVQLDNIYGGTPNATAPMITVKKSGNAVANGSTEEFGAISAQATATYTITNVGNGTLTITSPVTTTGLASAEVSATSLANGESATLTVTLPAEAPYGVKDGAVTLQTSLGNFVINYTANVLNPNALDEQFANGHPAGWYMGSAWSVSSQEATQESNTVSDLITEQLVVTGTDDALTFQAARNSNYSQPKMTVSYSTDRLNWTEVDLSDVTLTTSYQTITINGLEAGSYYLKIRGSRIKVDNFLGWEKKNNTHDLYVTATSFPATTEKGSEAVISATVTSLIADEQGVYAKLFIDDEEEGEPTEAQDITLNGTQTFSFTYAIPENKTAQVKIYFSDGTEAFATAVNDMKVNYSFNEEEAPEAVSAGTFDITLNRVFAEGFNTLCLPFDVNATEIHSDAIVYDFTGYNSLTNSLEFSKVTELEAGKPYIVYVPELIESKTFTEKTIPLTAVEAGSKDFSSVCFQGSYAPMEAGSLAGCYGLTTAGKIAKASATVTMKGFRGYFTGVPAGARAFFIGEDSTTGIQTLTVEESAVEGTYNLQGQKVSNVKQRGIYIINGKKQVVK